MERQGYGIGKGMGYKNLVLSDPFIHSLNAKGIKSKAKKPKKSKTPNLDKMKERTDFVSVLQGKSFRKDFGMIATPQKRGLIRELARKVVDGVDYAVEWEKEHLPKQAEWVKKEFTKAKEEAEKLGKAGIQKFKELAKKKDLDDVRNELDINDDGVQDIPVSELNKANQQIVQGLDTIDLNKNGVPDHQEDGFTNLYTETPVLPSYTEPSEEIVTNKPVAPIPFMTGEPPEPEPQPEPELPFEPLEVDYAVEEPKKGGLPIPMMTGEDLQKKPKGKTFLQKAGEFAKKEYQVGRQYVKTKQIETRELHQISDQKLRQLAIQEGSGVFGGMNKYEREVLRREKEKKFLDEKIKAIRSGEATGGGFGDAFGFLNPVATLSKKPKSKSGQKSEQVIPDSLSFVNPLTAFKPRVRSVPKEQRYYDKKLKPKIDGLNKGFEPFGFLNPVKTLSKR